MSDLSVKAHQSLPAARLSNNDMNYEQPAYQRSAKLLCSLLAKLWQTASDLPVKAQHSPAAVCLSNVGKASERPACQRFLSALLNGQHSLAFCFI